MAGKNELSEAVAKSIEGISKGNASELVDIVFDTITRLLEQGETVSIPGFGSFSVVQRAARKGRNPVTGESITIKASKKVRFKESKEGKDTTGSTGPRRR